jgi:hypothetical protein
VGSAYVHISAGNDVTWQELKIEMTEFREKRTDGGSRWVVVWMILQVEDPLSVRNCSRSVGLGAEVVALKPRV